MKFLALFTIAILCSSVRCTQKVLGVRPERASLYDPSKPFTCLDGAATIPFSQVNDDYCDCRDGSDEPGTAACLNGHFACENLGFIVQMIPSSRVNDGICATYVACQDCCDGSDETNNGVECENTCDVLAAKKREVEEKYKLLTQEGLNKKKQMIEEGSLLRKQIQESIEDLVAKRDSLESERNNHESLKKEAEEKANAAKAVQDLIFEQKAAQEKQLQDAAKAKALFEFLDISKDGLLTPEELVSFPELDILFNNDGEFSIEESRQLLDENNQITGEVFAEIYYEKISPHITKATEEVKNTDEEVIATSLTDNLDEDHNDGSEEEALQEDSGIEDEEHSSNVQDPPAVNKYDDETQHLIDEADSLRRKYDQAEREYNSADRELKEKEAQLNYDVGNESEFAIMINNCYEFSDREYIYKICPFNKCSQISKSSNSDTSIGVWSSWGPEGADKYKSMVFTNGLGCWNGPQRSTKVFLSCGLENKIVSVSEPNKCEYEMKFETPAVCEQMTSDEQISHQEL